MNEKTSLLSNYISFHKLIGNNLKELILLKKSSMQSEPSGYIYTFFALYRKCIWMRHGNRVIRALVPKAATEAAAAAVDEFDTVD